MKLTDFLSDVGRPVAYYPELRKITGSTNATILLCQFIYWRGKESDNDGWLYKTADEIEKETGLSYGEQKTARRDLISAGLLDEHYARLDHQMKFKLNLDAINEKWGKPQTEIPESGKPQLGNEGNPLSLNESEITTENTPSVLSAKDVQQTNALVDAILSNGHPQDELTAINAFEQAFGLDRPWNWYPDAPSDKRKTWKDFREYVKKLYSVDPDCFTKYVTWSRQDYVKGSMTALGIKRNPQDFPDSWSAFSYSTKYHPETKTAVKRDENNIPVTY